MISVIVPIYNVEAYLPQCLDSIVSQTYKDLEIILVDDGSTDSSGRICDEFADKDVRIRVIHQKNSGLPEARNSGLKVAKGDYIIMPDGDDALHPQMIEILYNLIIDGDYDFSMCYGEYIYNIDVVKERVLRPIRVSQVVEMSRDSAFKNLWVLSDVQLQYGVVWNKLYKRNLVDTIGLFAETAAQDLEYNNRAFLHTDKVVLAPEYLYYYIQRETSILHQKNSLHSLNNLHTYHLSLSEISQNNKLYRSYCLATMFHRFFNVRYRYKGTPNYHLAKETIEKYRKQYQFEFYSCSYILPYEKFKFIVFYYLPFLYSFVIILGEYLAKVRKKFF